MKKIFLVGTMLVIFFLIISCTKKSSLALTETPGNDEATTKPTTTIQIGSTKPDDMAEYPKGDILISEIQGTSHISPYKGEEIKKIIGIVTTFSGEGFYIQSPHPDDDPATSEGLFIYNPGLQKVKQGDLVSVSGRVIEHYPAGGQGELSITELVYIEYEILSSGHDLPEPVLIGINGRMPPTEIIDDDQLQDFDPENDGLDFYESLESMLIEIDQAISVAPINKYRELAVVPDLGVSATTVSERGVLTITPTDFNPERLLIDDALRSLPDDVPVGTTFQDALIGIVDYTFGMYKIQPIANPSFVYGGITPNVAPTQPENSLSIAAYNVENLDALDPIARFSLFADHVVNFLKSPDLLVLSEVQDNDGALSSNITSADLTGKAMIEAILAIGGPEYHYIDIAPKDDRDGGEAGGNIRTAFLYRSDRGLSLVHIPGGNYEYPVEFVGSGDSVTLSASPARIDPTNYAFRSSRKPLVGQFTYKGQTLFIVGTHMNSKNGDTPLFGQTHPPRLDSEKQRLEQAEVLADFVNKLLESSPDAMIILAGDLNDFQFSPILQKLTSTGLINPALSIPITEQYTYIYEGNAQMLDHILVSPAFNDRLSHFEIIHLNSEQPFRERLSDHDAVYSLFSWD